MRCEMFKTLKFIFQYVNVDLIYMREGATTMPCVCVSAEFSVSNFSLFLDFSAFVCVFIADLLG